MNPEIIKAYLVKLGVQVDTAAFDKMKSLLADIEKAMGKHASSIGMQMTKGAGLVVGAIATIDVAIVKTIEKVAEADMKYQLLAQSMFMNVDAAKAYKMATDTLGASLHQIAWNAELKEQYFRLVKDVNDLKVPQEARDMFRQVRDVGFEFKRSKLLATEFIEHTAFQLLKLNKGPLADLKSYLKDMNENFKSNIKVWAENLAKFLQPFIQLGSSAIKVLDSLWTLISTMGGGVVKVLTTIWDSLSDIDRQIVAVGALIVMLFAPAAPVIMAAKAFLALLLLIDDAMAFNEGRESMTLLEPVWESLTALAHGAALAVVAAMAVWDKWTGKIKTDKNTAGYVKEQMDIYTEMAAEDYDAKRAKAKAAKEKRLGKKSPATTAPATTAPIGTGSKKGKSMSEATASKIDAAANKYGISKEDLRAIAQMESGGDPNAVSKTGAAGTFQFTKGTAKQMGLVDRFNEDQNIDAGARLYVQNRAALRKKLGREPSAYEIYIAHQQGAGGASQIIKAAQTGDASKISSTVRRNMDLNVGRGKDARGFLEENKKHLQAAKMKAMNVGDSTLTTAQLQNARKEKFKSMMDKRGNLVSGASRTPVAGPTSVDQRVIVQVDARGATEKDAQAIASKTAEAVKKATVKLAKNEKQNVGIKQMATATS